MRLKDICVRWVALARNAALWPCALLVVLVALPAPASAAPDISKDFPFTVHAQRMVVADAARAGARLVMVGERGHIMLSDDEGVAWRSARTALENDLTKVFFHDAKRGWAVGHRGAALFTEDGGETWKQAKLALPENNALMDVMFTDANHGIAIGSFGIIAETDDGGRTWQGRQAVAGDFDPHLYGMTRDPSGRIFIAGESGTLLRSTDGGKTWSKLQSPYAGSYFGIISLQANRLLSFGMRGNIFISDDAGEHWDKVDTGITVTMQGAAYSRDHLLVLVGNDGMTAISKDNGKSFAQHKTHDRRSIASVLFAERGGLLLFGEAGFFRTAPETRR